jgi:hypothetical protein
MSSALAKALTILAGFGLIIAAHAQLVTTNLLVNPGAETGSLAPWVADDWSGQPQLNPFVGSPTNSFGDGFPTHSGNYYFVGGSDGWGILSQMVSLVGNQGITADLIDSGSLRADFSFWEQSLDEVVASPDWVDFFLTFYDATTTNALGTATICCAYSLSWQKYSSQCTVPSGARFARYMFKFYPDSVDTNIDVFVDDASLRVVEVPHPNVPGTGTALSFNGANSYVSFNTAGALTSTFTIELWVNPLGYGNPYTLVSSRQPGDYSFLLQLWPYCSCGRGPIQGSIGNGSTWLTTSADSDYPANGGSWLHLAYVVTPTNYTVYGNGFVVGQGSYPSDNPVLYDSDHNLVIGASRAGDVMYGLVDEVRIWDTARSTFEINMDMNHAPSPFEPGLMGYWRFDEGSGNTSADLSGNGFDAVLHSVNWVASTAPVGGPQAQTQPATGLTAVSATLNGLAALDYPAVAWFEYGTDTDYVSFTPVTNVSPAGPFDPWVAVGTLVGGLSPSTVYHFRLVAMNAAGTSYGSDETFTTPFFSVGPATNITAVSATLTGTVFPTGQDVGVWFEYGPDHSNSTPLIKVSGTNAGPVMVSSVISGLLPSTVYSYRMVDAAASGMKYASLNFTTLPPAPFVGSYGWTTLAGRASSGSMDGVGSQAQFHGPSDLAVDTNGNLYVCDAGNQTIRKITPAGVVTTIAGFPGSAGSADGTNSAARFNSTGRIATGGDGRLYVTDGNHTVRRLTPYGTNWVVDTIAGQVGNPGTNDGPGLSARFVGLGGVTVDDAGNIYVTDPGSYTVRRITPTGTNWTVSTIAGQAGTPGTNDGVGGIALFKQLHGIVVDRATNLYVADGVNSTIRKLTFTGTDWTVSTIAGSAGFHGGLDGTNTAATFHEPTGITVDTNGVLYVSDDENYTIRKVTPIAGTADWAVTTLAGQAYIPGSADRTGTNALFNQPSGVAVDRSGNVYVADEGNNTIRKITTAAAVRTIAGQALAGGSADGVGSAARFSSPQAVAVDHDGNVYVADTMNHTIRQVTSAGEVTTIAGLAGVSGTNDGVADEARFNQPNGIAVGSDGNIYVVDNTNSRIRQITSAAVVSTIAGSDSGTNDGPGVAGVAARFQTILGITAAPDGELFVSDSSRIRKLTGPIWYVTTVTQLPYNVKSLAVDTAGNLYLLKSSYILDPDPLVQKRTPGGVVSTISTSYPIGSGGLAVDDTGSLFISDFMLGVIWKFVPEGGNWVPLIVGGGGGLYGGSSDGVGNAARFSNPGGMATDDAGNVYLADSGNNTIRKGVPTAYIVANPVPYAPPPPSAQLSVTLQPDEAVAAGAKWRFPWEFDWRESGSVASNLTAGNYEIEFRDAPGWLAPTNDVVAVAANSSNSLVYSYFETIGSDQNASPGSVTVNFGASPPDAARWGFLGEAYAFTNNYSATLSPGTYLIGFLPITNYSTPPNMEVLVLPGQPVLISAKYLLAQSKPGGVELPAPVSPASISDLADYPFGFNGQLQSEVGFGSGVAVDANVVLTAAHVVFNDETLTYASEVWWFLQKNPGITNGPPLRARGTYVLSDYAAQRKLDRTNGKAVDESTPQSRNLDVAALYFPFPVAGGGYGGYLPSDASPNPWLTGTSSKMLVGYPVDGSMFGDTSITNGVMYETGPQPYPLSLASEPVFNQQVYVAPWLLSYPGNSGGPLYVQYNGYYYPAGVYLGTLYNGSVPYASLVRAIDSEVVNLITNAATLGDRGTNGTGGGVIHLSFSSSGATNVAYLTVLLGPAEARTAGAAWKIPGSMWHNGESNRVTLYTNGTVSIQFTNIPGWEAPSTNAPLILGTNTTVTAIYTPFTPLLSFVPGAGLSITGTPGAKFALDFRTSLSSGDWVPLKTNALGPGLNQWLPWPPTNGPAGFYRARWVQ